MEEKRNVYAVLRQVQREINVPKDQYNAFGKYKFRNLESINKEVKRVCDKYGCGYLLTDHIISIDGEEQRPMLLGGKPVMAETKCRFYCGATVTFFLDEGGDVVTSRAYAREEAFKTGMDEAQVSGLASSYARKYAMCGMFAIDSGEEVDAMDHDDSAYYQPKPRQAKKPAKKTVKMQTELQANELAGLVNVYAMAKEKTNEEVMAALMGTKTMKESGVKPGQKKLTEEQHEKAMAIVKHWIELSNNSEGKE